MSPIAHYAAVLFCTLLLLACVACILAGIHLDEIPLVVVGFGTGTFAGVLLLRQVLLLAEVISGLQYTRRTRDRSVP